MGWITCRPSRPAAARRLRLRGEWDGFRAIVSTEAGLEVRSRRGWSMAERLPIFDVLRVEGGDTMCLPYAERRELLDQLDLDGPAWWTPQAFDDGEAAAG
jgi:hypothetical protein